MAQNEPDTNRAQRIIKAYQQMRRLRIAKFSASVAAGRLLTQQRAEMTDLEFRAWVTENLGFSFDTAQKYMRIYQRRSFLWVLK